MKPRALNSGDRAGLTEGDKKFFDRIENDVVAGQPRHGF